MGWGRWELWGRALFQGRKAKRLFLPGQLLVTWHSAPSEPTEMFLALALIARALCVFPETFCLDSTATILAVVEKLVFSWQDLGFPQGMGTRVKAFLLPFPCQMERQPGSVPAIPVSDKWNNHKSVSMRREWMWGRVRALQWLYHPSASFTGRHSLHKYPGLWLGPEFMLSLIDCAQWAACMGMCTCGSSPFPEGSYSAFSRVRELCGSPGAKSPFQNSSGVFQEEEKTKSSIIRESGVSSCARYRNLRSGES